MNQKEQYAARSTQNVAVSTESVYPCTTAQDVATTNILNNGKPGASAGTDAPGYSQEVSDAILLIRSADTLAMLNSITGCVLRASEDPADRVYMAAAYDHRRNQLEGKVIKQT